MNAIKKRTIARKTAFSKFPLLLSRTIAVVIILVLPEMFPPTIRDAPTSEIAEPKPAIIAENSGIFASFHIRKTLFKGENPRVLSWKSIIGSRLWIELIVKPTIIGKERIAWAITIAKGVYRR